MKLSQAHSLKPVKKVSRPLVYFHVSLPVTVGRIWTLPVWLGLQEKMGCLPVVLCLCSWNFCLIMRADFYLPSRTLSKTSLFVCQLLQKIYEKNFSIYVYVSSE